MKNTAGFVLLLVAFLLGWHGKTQGKSDDQEQRRYIQMAGDARDREAEIMSLQNKLTMDGVAVADAIVKQIDPSAAQAEQAKDKARLAKLEQAEQVMGTARMNEDAAVRLAHHRWEITAMYAGALVLGLVGLVMMFA